MQISIHILCRKAAFNPTQSDQECVGAAVAAGVLLGRGQSDEGWNDGGDGRRKG